MITYQTSDGLNSNVITSLYVNEKNDLFIANHEKGINILRDNKIENFRSSFKRNNEVIQHFLITNNFYYAFSAFGSIIRFSARDKNGTDDKVFRINLKNYNATLNKIIEYQNDEILVLTTKGILSLKNNLLDKFKIDGLPEKEFISCAKDNDGSILVAGNGFIYRIKNNHLVDSIQVKLFDQNIVYNTFIDSHRNIWFTISGKGFYLIKYGTKKIIDFGKKFDLENSQVNKFYEDREGNIWVATFGNGVFCLANLFIENYSDKDGLSNNYINCILKEKSGKILLGTINGLNFFDNEKIACVNYSSGEQITGYINNLTPENGYVYVSLTSEQAKIKEFTSQNIKFRFFRTQSFAKINEGCYLFGSVGNNYTIQHEFNYKAYPKWNYIISDSSILNRVNFIYKDSHNNIWFGTKLGLCKFISQQNRVDISKWQKQYFLNNLILNSNITSITEHENNIWVTSTNGVAKYNLDDQSIINYKKVDGYDLSFSTSIAFDNKNRIWIGNAKGVFLFDGTSMKYLNSNIGLPSNEVTSIYFDSLSNKLYIGTSNGLSVLDVNQFVNIPQRKLDIKIMDIKAGENFFNPKKELVFQPEQHDVTINYKAISFSNPASIKYKFKLNDDNWIETQNDFLNFISLKHGNYNLQIAAKSQNSNWSKPYKLAFTISPTFTETKWFDFLIIIGAASFSVFIIIHRLKLKNKKIKAELELSERINTLKHQALSAMMNPHFIFNSLNSVQYLINSKQNEEANNYIAMMAKLIRKNLDTASNGFILLSEEINRLKLYLDLEKLRFQDKFSYEIILGDDVFPDSVLIPNMIIQPFVENSLWHGIINSGRNGFLTISFLFENIEIDSNVSKSLIIKVTDNGVGIKLANQNKREDHISKGIQIVEERLKLLSRKMELPKPIIIEDLSEKNKNTPGTEVIISLSKPLFRNI